MAKKWTDLTRREKIIGTAVSVGAVLLIGGMASAAGNAPTPAEPTTGTQPSTQQPAKPVVTTKDVSETSAVSFTSTTVNDGTMASGTTEVSVQGVDGVRTKTWTVTYMDGKETGRALKSDEVTTQPVAQVTNVGTYVAPAPAKKVSSCDPNYSGGCVPIASDVDCAGGSGNGPAYVSGPVYVIGSDIYGLDRDGNGTACE